MTDVAIESADVTLMRGSLHGVADAIAVSGATVRNIKRLTSPIRYNVIVVDTTEFWFTGGRIEHHLHDYVFANKADAQPIEKADITGRSCYGDRLCPFVPIPPVEVGDVLAMIEQRRFSFQTFPVVDGRGCLIGLLPGSDTGAFECAMWSLLGAKPVTAMAWESFGEGWVTDIVKQLKLKDTRVLADIKGAAPITVADLTDYLRMQYFHGSDQASQSKKMNAQKQEAFDAMMGANTYRLSDYYAIEYSSNLVPEPATFFPMLMVLTSGLCCMLVRRRLRRRAGGPPGSS